MAALVPGLTWLGHASFSLQSEAGGRIYMDPWRVGESWPAANLILVTHEHHDHCSVEDIVRLAGPGTTIIASPRAAEVLRPAVTAELRVLEPGESCTVGQVSVTAVPAHNTNKFRAPGVFFHPPEARHVGYVLQADGKVYYLSGDTDFIPEAVAAFPVDVAIVPVSGKYVMTAAEAAEAVSRLRPRVGVPAHYGTIVGDADDARRFQEQAAVPVAILTKTEHYRGAEPR